jgi:hypothetical protein
MKKFEFFQNTVYGKTVKRSRSWSLTKIDRIRNTVVKETLSHSYWYCGDKVAESIYFLTSLLSQLRNFRGTRGVSVWGGSGERPSTLILL